MDKRKREIRKGIGDIFCPIPADIIPFKLNLELKDVLAVGAEIKGTFCLTKGNLAFLSQPIGDLKNLETLQLFKQEIERYKKLLLLQQQSRCYFPEIIAHDLHPDYLSTRYAFELAMIDTKPKTYPVQHHHAHIASCMADNGVNERVIGVAADGMGYGNDGKIWGFEFLVSDVESFYRFERLGHLKYIPMPGGDQAVNQPWRMAVSYLYLVYGDNIPDEFIKRFGKENVSFIIKMIEHNINLSFTSSCGRLFDAVSSILGIRDIIDYEAQAAIELEDKAALLSINKEDTYRFEIITDSITDSKTPNPVFIIDPSLTIMDIVQDKKQGIDLPIISTRFHNTIARYILNVCQRIRKQRGINLVALSGGVFQNNYLLKKTKEQLEKQGFITLTHFKIPTNDIGISLGQAVIASR